MLTDNGFGPFEMNGNFSSIFKLILKTVLLHKSDNYLLVSSGHSVNMKDERYIFEEHGYSCHMKSHTTSAIYCCVISIVMFHSYKIPQVL
jgi:hypothetical protein